MRSWAWPLLLTLAMAGAGAHPLCPKPIDVGFYDFGAHYDARNGEGIDTDLVRALGERSGCSFRPLYLSRVLIWRRLASGQLDMTVSGLATPERQRYAEFLPYMQTRNVILMRAELKGLNSPAEFEAMPALHLGVVLGYKHGAGWDDWIEGLRNSGRVETAGDLPTLMRLLDSGRVDAVPIIPTVLPGLLQQRGEQAPPLLTQPWFNQQPKQEACLAMSRQRMTPALRQHLAASLAQLKREGVLSKILHKHLGDEEARAAALP
ncbi:transporter substrate-binding domain-containing protein [Paucibacter sediminis]|uniref:Transporter substrate-binding domain-containing protein n=1 Tax=Paucibacter sediminis TaxID=3019553 RepID=A0AA95NIB4_9BURK|nr:transporter substrate-binding domain-containing protein [Paucibacter sp. S2-9]WIT12929.1 transporter substrate-binding domain-containing protein [Paucibacter sp. S2-9]